jgi:hypothetical protein
VSEVWNTAQEIKFLDELGMHQRTDRFLSRERAKSALLASYIRVLPFRRWDPNIDVPAVETHAQALFADLLEQMQKRSASHFLHVSHPKGVRHVQ